MRLDESRCEMKYLHSQFNCNLRFNLIRKHNERPSRALSDEKRRILNCVPIKLIIDSISSLSTRGENEIQFVLSCNCSLRLMFSVLMLSNVNVGYSSSFTLNVTECLFMSCPPATNVIISPAIRSCHTSHL